MSLRNLLNKSLNIRRETSLVLDSVTMAAAISFTLGKAFEKLGLAVVKEMKSPIIWILFFMTFLLGMIVEHYFGEWTLLSILWK